MSSTVLSGLSLTLIFASNFFAPSEGRPVPGSHVNAATVQPLSHRHKDRKRVITVSVLNDQKAPVDDSLISNILSAASRDFAEQVNISFTIKEILPYNGDLTLYPLDQAFLLRRLHVRGEIRIIFTNQSGYRNDSLANDAAGPELAGSSHSVFGYLIVYNAEKRLAKKDQAGNSALRTALKHELAHLFGVGHSADPRSFMYTPSSLSLGEWTEEVTNAINEHRNKKWFSAS
ncbi:MAG TPA: matrixin family metalloprotease [Blastocatellia bacterium]|nr:matrixin family metalloprotease [Blastocatellia bacterium]